MAKEIIQKFEFGLDAGTTAIGTHKLGVLPGGATITEAWIDVETTFTDGASDTATIALGITGTVDFFDAAIAISDASNPWDAIANGVVRNADKGADGTAAGFYKISSAAEVIATVATAPLTAGQGFLYVKYVFN
jgi:hypothetical protein